MAKKNIKPSYTYVKPTVLRAGREFEYQMSAEGYADLVQESNANHGGDAQTYLCNYVNEQYGLLGSCVRVVVG